MDYLRFDKATIVFGPLNLETAVDRFVEDLSH